MRARASDISIVNPMPSNLEPWEKNTFRAESRSGIPVTRDTGTSEAVISGTTCPSACRCAFGPTCAQLVHTAAYSRAADFDGHGLLLIDRRIVTPLDTSWSSPTSRVSACARVLVAINPACPELLSRECARRAKYATRSHLPPARTPFALLRLHDRGKRCPASL